MTSTSQEPNSSPRRWGMRWVKWGLTVAVLYFVAQRARLLWSRTEGAGLDSVELHPGWLVAAGLVYLVGWLPSVWFWRRMMNSLGGDVGTVQAARAYYCGHLGKYIPGKATVLVIRAGLVRSHGCRAGVAALTATYETLAFMGVGLGIGCAAAPWLWGPAINEWLPEPLRWMAESPAVFPAVVVVSVAAVLPVIARIFNLIAKKMTPSSIQGEGGESFQGIGVGLLGQGFLAFVAAWGIHGLSLLCTIKAFAPEAVTLSDLPTCAASAATATSVGFVALFAPGGLGIREGLLMETLRIQPTIGATTAVLAAIVLRIVWFVAEIGVSLVLYWLKSDAPAPDAETKPN